LSTNFVIFGLVKKNQMRKYLLGAALLTFLFAAACNKDRNYTHAMILDSGDVTTEGCGYLLLLENGEEKKPVSLPSAFQHNGIQVLVKYNETGIRDTCEFAPPRKYFDMISIEDIKRRND